MARDIVAYCNGLSKTEFWSLGMGDVQNLLDEALEEIERLRVAAAAMLKRYVALVESGDCGNWDPYGEPEVVALRSALIDGRDDTWVEQFKADRAAFKPGPTDAHIDGADNGD